MTNQTRICSAGPTLAVCALLLLSLSGCQPQSQNGGGLFGQRTPFNSGNGTFGAQANSTFSGSSFNNPFAQRNTNPSGLPQLSQSGNNGTFQGQLQQPGMAREYDRINQQLGAFDADNQLLNTEVATLKQKLELANQYNQTLKQQLADTSDRINRSGNQQKINEQQFASMRQENEQLRRRITDQDRLLAQRSPAQDWQGQGANSPFRNSGFSNNRGSATIRANNGLMQKFNSINIPGGDARMDGDIIRIEFPTDRLFASGSYQVQRSQLPLLQNVASTIRQSFPNQIVGIEAHWDGTPLNPPGTTDHQLTATQSLAVLDELVRLGLPSKQLFNMALGSNRPRHRQQMVAGVSPNRRIELVIYPESYDGR